MSNNLLNVIKEVFSTYNYSVSPSQQGFDLLAEKPGNKVGIKVADGASADDLKQFLDSLNGNNVKVLFVTMAGFSEDVKKLGKQGDVLLWDRSELEKQIGKAVLSGCESGTTPFSADIEVAKKPSDISSLTQELYAHSPVKPAPQPQPQAQPRAAKPAPAADAGDVIEAVGEEPVKKPVARAKPKPEAEEVAEAADELDGASIPLHTIPIKIKGSDAVRISGAIGRAEDVEVSLKFIPFWKYDYILDVQARYRDMTVPLNSKGSKMINAINKSVELAPTSKPIETVELPDAPYNVEMSVVTEDEANAMAIKAIIEENTKTVRFKGTQGEAAIVEHKKFQPKPSDVDMQMELLYIPYWVIRSHKGYMEINGYDGKPTKMPMDDGAEIL